MTEGGWVMGKLTFVMLISFFVFTNNAFADKIYLKSGKVLEGKLKENRNPMPWDDWCVGNNDIQVWNNGSGQCIPKSDIEKVEKKFKKPEGIALLANDNNWGEEGNGYKTQLILAGNEYAIGQPMTFHLVMKNIGTDIKWYDNQAISHNALIIKDTNGKEAYYKKGSFQTAGGERPIDTGEIIPLFENRNITNEYVIAKPGKYTIQFRGGNYGMSSDSTFPPSNTIEFEVKAGTSSQDNILISSLLETLPDKKWQLTPRWRRDDETPLGRNPVKGSSIEIVRYAKLKVDVVSMTLWQTDEPSEVSAQQKEGEKKVSEYLGHSPSGQYYYIHIPLKVEEYWPSVREDIIKALNLEK